MLKSGQATDNMAHEHCMLETKATNTLSRYAIKLTVFNCNNIFTNAPACHILRTYIAYLFCLLSPFTFVNLAP